MSVSNRITIYVFACCYDTCTLETDVDTGTAQARLGDSRTARDSSLVGLGWKSESEDQPRRNEWKAASHATINEFRRKVF